MENFIQKHKKLIILIVILLSFSGPILVHFWSLIPSPIDIINPCIDESDMLSYYSTTLSCFCTIILGYIAVKQSDNANELSKKMFDSEIIDKKTFVSLDEKLCTFDEQYRMVGLKFINITNIPIIKLEIEGCDKKIIDNVWPVDAVKENDDKVFMTKYDSICNSIKSDNISNLYELYLINYNENFRILSFKVKIKNIYGYDTVQYFNVCMVKDKVMYFETIPDRETV